MAGAPEELPPLVQDLIARYDPALSQPQFDKMSRGQQDAVRDMNKSLERLAKSAAMRQERLLAEELRKQNEVIRKATQQREKLALTAGKREGEIVKATSREVVVARERASTQEIVAQRKASNALVADRRKGMARWEEVAERAYFRMRGKRQKANQQEGQDQQRSNRSSRDDQARAFKTWFAQFDDFLKRRRAKERAAQFEHLANQKAAHRAEWQTQKAADSRSLADQKAANSRALADRRAALRLQVIDHQAAAAKTVNAHKAMWAMVRGATETGGRFMSSITQSFLRSMGSGVSRGLSRITGTYRREGEQQQAALRANYAQQEQITRRAMVRQQGAMQGFQQRNAAVAQGGAGGGPIGAIMSVRNMLLGAGAFISARAIFGPVMDYQKYQVSFEALLGSAERAGVFLDRLRQFSANTPFNLAAITESSQKLLAFGFAARDVIPMMTTIGDSASALGQGEESISGVIRALGQMQGRGKAAAEEMNQISDALPGFSAIEAVANKMGITVAEAFDEMRAGAIPADLAIEAIMEGMANMPGAAGAMDRAAKTLQGRLQNLRETLTMLMVDAISPFTDEMAKAVGAVTSLIVAIAQGSGVWSVVRSAIMGLAIALGSMLAYQGVVLMLDGIKLALIAIAQNPAIVVFTGLVTAMVMLYRHVPAVTEVVNDMRDAFVNFFNQTRQALGLLMDGDFPAFFDRMQSIGEDLLAALAPSANVIRDFFMDAFERAKDWVEGGALGAIAEKIGEALSAVVNSDAVEWLVEFGKASWQRWQDWLDGGGLGDLADAIKMRLLDAFAKVSDALGGIDWEQLLGPALAAAAVVVAGLILGWPLVIGGALVAALIAFGPRLRDGLSQLFGQAQEWVSEAFGAVDWAAVGMSILEGLRMAGEFLGGSVLSAIFSETGLKIMGAVLLGVLAALGAFALGFAQGLSDTIPKLWRNLGTLLSDGLRSLGSGAFAPLVAALADTLGDAFTAMAASMDVMGAIMDAITGRGDWGDVGSAAVDALGEWFGLLFSAPALVRGLSDSLNQLLSTALAGASTAITEWASGIGGPLGGLVQAFAANFALILGVVSDVLDRVRDFVTGWIDIIVGLFTGDFGRVVEGIRGVWGAVLGLARDIFGRLQTYLWNVWTGMGSFIWGAAEAGFSWLKDRIFGWVMTVVNFWTGLPQTLANAFLGFGGLVLDAIKAGLEAGGGFAKDIVNGIIDVINTRVLDWISGRSIDMPIGPDINFPDLPHIPHLAKGGIVTSPTVALIGEAGPEAVIPLSDGMGQIPLSILFDTSMIAAQVEAVAEILAPLGERIYQATMPGLTAWAASVAALLNRMSNDFENWGATMVATATAIGTSIAAAMSAALREGRGEVTRIVRGYGRNLTDALNPLLRAVGEQPVALSFAKGGIAEAYQGAQVHVFNEGRRGRGSSHGEAYIPFDPANRPRSKALASETVRRLGGDVQWFANGGITAPQVAPGATVPGVTGDVAGLVNEFARRLSTWSLANGGGYHVGSGYRSFAEQARLYQRYLAGVPGQAPAAPPGSSMHNFGLASDGNHWRNRNPEAFGLRFPMSYEPWHVEPKEGKGLLGGDTALEMFQPLPRPPGAGERGLLSIAATKWMEYVYAKVLAGSSAFSMSPSVPALGSGGAPPNILAAIQRAMSIVGVPSSWLGPLLTLISRESGFNPGATNNWDSNAAKGQASRGLMQTIPSTFAAYALPGYGGITDPVANVIAGLRYILARYGSIFNVQQANASLPPRGYSYGGVVDREGMYRLAEGNRREVVLPLENRGRLTELLRRTGLDKTIALAASPDLTASAWSAPDSATSRSSAPSVGEVYGVREQHFHTNAVDERTVAAISARKTAKEVRRALVGVG